MFLSDLAPHLRSWALVLFGHTPVLQGVFPFLPWTILSDLLASNLFNLYLNKRPVSLLEAMQSYFSLTLDSPGDLRPFNMLTCIVNQQEGGKGIPSLLIPEAFILNPVKQNTAVLWIHFCVCQISFPKAMVVCIFFQKGSSPFLILTLPINVRMELS